MSYRYGPVKKLLIKLWRKLRPSVDSPYTIGPVDDICAVQLVDPEKMQNFFADCINTLRSLRGDEIGDYLEFGVFNGTSLSNMYFAARRCGLSSMRLIGFDAFEGLPLESEKEDAGVFRKGFYTCSFSQSEECLLRKNINPDDITWVKGWYRDTLNQETAEKYNIKPGIVFIDCDTYSSSKSALDFIAPLIVDPVIISLDDWRLYSLDIKGGGEYKSFNEFLETNLHFRAKEIKTYKRNSRTFLITPDPRALYTVSKKSLKTL
jgi:hypothetical protein